MRLHMCVRLLIKDKLTIGANQLTKKETGKKKCKKGKENIFWVKSYKKVSFSPHLKFPVSPGNAALLYCM